MSASFQHARDAESSSQRRVGPCSDVTDGALRRLRQCAYPALHAIECEYHEGVVTLRGRLTSYFLKQMAQELVARQPGVEEITNRIEVVP